MSPRQKICATVSKTARRKNVEGVWDQRQVCGRLRDYETPGTKEKRAHQRKMIKEHKMKDNGGMICKGGVGWEGVDRQRELNIASTELHLCSQLPTLLLSGR